MSSINFFQEQQNNIIDRLVQWTLTYGRMVIMVTYSVALVAFLYRFTVDYRLTNLHDQIKNDQIIVNAMSDSESLFRNLQARLQLIGQINSTSAITVNRLKDLIEISQGNITFTDVSISDKSELAVISTNSIEQLNSFVTNIKQLKYVTDINIENIQNKISTGQVNAVLNITTN